MRLRSQGWGVCERESYHTMSNTEKTQRVAPASSDTLLEALPDALFVVDDAATIVYANASAQALIVSARLPTPRDEWAGARRPPAAPRRREAEVQRGAAQVFPFPSRS